jgi:light-regulated signal transduction histidine kinase (bacteriophytochrome)
MRPSPIKESAIDLQSCDREPIHLPGSIQPRGFLLALGGSDWLVLQASDNVRAFLGKEAAEVLGKPLTALLGDESGTRLLSAIGKNDFDGTTQYLGAIALSDQAHFDVLAHANDGLLFLEFEQVARKHRADFRLLYPLVNSFLTNLAGIDTLEHICDLAAREIKQVTGFGRVLVYRFDENQHGHVLAEALDPGYHSYLHQRFPASDIPSQARALYLNSRIRLISDADYQPSMLVPAMNPLTGKPTDLGLATLRSVSPVHIRYMKNMGTLSSMSISVIVKGKLWGLISCHHADPKVADFEARAACEQLGQILALRIESTEESIETNSRLEHRRILVSMLAALTHEANFVDNISAVSGELLRFIDASGAALVFEGRVERYGEAPSEDDIRHLVEWISARVAEDVCHTDALPRLYPPARMIKEQASGILALPISQIHRHYLIWFRPEVVKTIEWAGNPHEKNDAGGNAPLTPRTSFEGWREIVVDTSLPWTRTEIEMALEFRTALLGIVLKRAEQMAELSEELGRANKELESFSYSVSHDLRAPLRHIVGFTDLLLEYEKERLSDRGMRYLNNIKASARFAGKLVDDLLSFSQMGRAALRIRSIDMSALVKACMEKIMVEGEPDKTEWRLDTLPVIEGDPAFLQLALSNLFSNAVKYSRNRDKPVISVTAEQNDSEYIFHVADNGVGFNMDYVHKLFGIFQRLHRMEEFEGTGIGLANVRRIVERHGGRVWATGVPDAGAVFSFSIPKRILLMDGDKHA